jgi:G3E family GTPase
MDRDLSMSQLKSIPCNIITGFLGVGKTTTILNLLKQKPAHEKWAVLVNEFGEIGLDGALLSATQKEPNSVFIKEVPGGCMCCASGLPMQIALNMLLMKAKPDRLLIEPTGLGHPKEIIKVLSGKHYQEVLSLKNTITLVDARHFSSQKHLANQTFQQQLDVADLLVANKADLYSQHDIQAFEVYLSNYTHLKLKPYLFIQHGVLDVEQLGLEALDIKQPVLLKHTCHKVHTQDSPALTDDSNDIPSCGYIVKLHKEGNFTSVGWRITSAKLFDMANIKRWINTLDAKRVKAVLKSEAGFIALNISSDSIRSENIDSGSLEPETTNIIQNQQESRIELIFEDQHITDDMLKNWTTFLTR